MKRLLIVGSGDVALRALPLLLPHYRVYALLRNPVRHVEWRARGAIPLAGDLDDRTRLARISGIADMVLHFAPPAGGERDARTRNLLAALSQGALPKRIVYISTSGVYGDCGGAQVSETRPPNPQTARARLRLDAERQISEAWTPRPLTTGSTAATRPTPASSPPPRAAPTSTSTAPDPAHHAPMIVRPAWHPGVS
jgi:nucleoside-diphosphate-sugar epimerase